MSVRKRTLPSGQIRWVCDYRDGGGARRFKQFKTKKEAEAFRDKTGVDVRAGVHTPDAVSATIREAGELWLQKCCLDGLEPATLRGYRQHLALHILPHIGNTKLSKMTKPAVENFRDHLVGACSAAMARKVLVSLKSLLSEAQRRGLVTQNMALGTKVRIAARHEKRVVVPAKDEIRSMLNATGELWPATLPWRPLVITALFTGLRASELRGLVWDHVDLEKRIIRVRQRADFRGKLGSPKSRAGNRDVPLAPMAVNILRQWKLACPRAELGLVFPAQQGGVAHHSVMHRMWSNLLKASGLSRYRFHDLRHTAASLFIEQGMQPKKIQTIMGHSSIKVTYDIYGHLWASPEDDQAAMAQVEARLLG